MHITDRNNKIKGKSVAGDNGQWLSGFAAEPDA